VKIINSLINSISNKIDFILREEFFKFFTSGEQNYLIFYSIKKIYEFEQNLEPIIKEKE
jgi:hypothetical protein